MFAIQVFKDKSPVFFRNRYNQYMEDLLLFLLFFFLNQVQDCINHMVYANYINCPQVQPSTMFHVQLKSPPSEYIHLCTECEL